MSIHAVSAVTKRVTKTVTTFLGVTMENCPLCQKDSPILDFGRPCCVARYIASLKFLEQRREWLARIAARSEPEFAALVEVRLKQIWGEGKKIESPGQD